MARKYSPERQREIALKELLRGDGRTKGKHISHRSHSKAVNPSPDNNHWVVSGGKATHAVRWEHGRFVCLDHEPDTHKQPDQLCTHEVAVYRHVADQYRTLLFTPAGRKRKPPKDQGKAPQP